MTYTDDEFYHIRMVGEKTNYGFTGDRDFFESGNITNNGEVVATYRQLSVDNSGPDGNARQLTYHMRRAINDPKTIARAAANVILIRLLTKRMDVDSRFGEMAGTLRSATKQKGNFGMGQATLQEAEAMGEAWVGVGHRVASDGKTLISADGLKIFRPPSFKPSLGKEQANFEWRVSPGGPPTGNGHLDIQ